VFFTVIDYDLRLRSRWMDVTLSRARGRRGNEVRHRRRRSGSASADTARHGLARVGPRQPLIPRRRTGQAA